MPKKAPACQTPSPSSEGEVQRGFENEDVPAPPEPVLPEEPETASYRLDMRAFDDMERVYMVRDVLARGWKYGEHPANKEITLTLPVGVELPAAYAKGLYPI